jgi:hypothetical protein
MARPATRPANGQMHFLGVATVADCRPRCQGGLKVVDSGPPSGGGSFICFHEHMVEVARLTAHDGIVNIWLTPTCQSYAYG